MPLFPQKSAFLPIYGPQVIAEAQLKVAVVKMDVGGGQDPDIVGDGIGDQDFLPEVFIFLVHALDSENRGPLAPLRIDLKVVVEGAQFHMQGPTLSVFVFLFSFVFVFLPFLSIVVVLELLSIVHGGSKDCLKAGLLEEKIVLRTQDVGGDFLIGDQGVDRKSVVEGVSWCVVAE